MTDDEQADDESTDRTERQPDADVLTIEYDWTENDRPSLGVVKAVAAASGREPTEMPPLQRFVDVEALDALLTHEGARSDGVTASFSYDGHDVVVDGTGAIRLAVEPGGDRSR